MAISGDWAVTISDGGNNNVHFYKWNGATWDWIESVVPKSELPVAVDVDIDGERAVFLPRSEKDNNSGRQNRGRVLELDEGGWRDIAEFDTDFPHASIALSGSTIACGAPARSIPFQGDSPGQVRIFTPSGSAWLHSQVILPRSVRLASGEFAEPEGFGRSVALDGDLLVVGMSDDGTPSAAFVYERHGGQFQQHWGEVASFVGDHSSFGQEVALSGTTFAVAAPDQPSAGGTLGATYVYEVDLDRDQFDAWRRGQFGDEVVDNPALEQTVWSPMADPDGDGLINLAEAYHGLDPTVPDASAAAVGITIGGDDVTLRWRRGLQTGGVLGDLEWSADLQQWNGMHQTGAPQARLESPEKKSAHCGWNRR